jgi:hypothetical protein
MDCVDSTQEMLENHWRGKVEAAEVDYSENPYTEARVAYLNVLKSFADLVLRGEAAAGSDGAQAVNGLPSLC